MSSDSTTNPEHEGPIAFRTPSGHLATLVSVYDSPVENTAATAADLIAALSANPQLRAAVLEGLGECMRWSIAEERMAAVITKLRLAESELAVERERLRVVEDARDNLRDWANASLESALGLVRLQDPTMQDVVHALFNANASLRAELAAERARVRELREQRHELRNAAGNLVESMKVSGSQPPPTVFKAFQQVELALRSSQQPAPPPAEHHRLNENTWCIRCDRFDPSGPCPGKPAEQAKDSAVTCICIGERNRGCRAPRHVRWDGTLTDGPTDGGGASPGEVKCKYCNRVGCESEKYRDDSRLLRMCRHAVQLERDFLQNRVGRVEFALKQAESERDRLRAELETERSRVLQLDRALTELTAKHEKQIGTAVEDVAYMNAKLEAAEAELPHLREAAELLRAEGTTTSDPQRHREWLARDHPSTAARSGSVGDEAAAQSSGTTPPLVRARNCLGHAERDHQKWMQRYDGEQGTFEDSRFSWLLSAVDDIARHLEAQRPLTLADVDRRIAELARAAGDLAGIDHFASRRALERLQEAAEAGKPLKGNRLICQGRPK